MTKSSEPVKITIEKLVTGGQAMAFYQGKALFVPLALPGEVVEVALTRHHKNFLEAELVAVIEPAKERVTPPCRYFGECGGCQWQHLDYEKQLFWKLKIVEETLQRIGKITDPNVLPVTPSPKQFGWRSRVTFHQNEKGHIGFFAPNSHRVVDIEECLIADEEVNEKLKALRHTKHDRAIMRSHDLEIRSTEGKSFSQVNPLQNENLKKIVREWATAVPHDFIVELFCGNGNFTQDLIPLAKKIIAVDSDRDAIDEAKIRLQGNFLCTDAVRYFAQLKSESPIDLLVLDPPRDGAAGVVEGVLKNRPKHILYISCNPASLARDLKYLNDFAGYTLVKCQPIDMFTMSHHIESVSLIQAPQS